MKQCHQCGAEMQDRDKFCMNCGSAYGENGGATSTLPQDNASIQQTFGQDKADSSVLVVAQAAPRMDSPPRPKRGSGLRTKLILGALLAIVLVAGGLWGWNTYGTEAQVQNKLDLAIKYISDNNYEQAILAFNDAIKIDPKEVKAYQGLAKTYTLQGNYDQAKNTYEQGIASVTPQNKQILQLGLAGMYIDQNKLTDAEQAYSQIMNASPNCLEAYWGLAMVHSQQGNNSKAEAILKQAVEKNPNEYRGYNTLALFLSQNSKPDEALDNIVQSLTLEINQQEAYLVLDSMYQNKWNELGSQASKMSDPNIAAILQFYSYYGDGDYRRAIDTYQSQLSTQTANHKVKILAATAMVKSGDQVSAASLIKQIDSSKLNPGLLSDLGRYYLAAGDTVKARDYAIKALQANSTDLDAIALLQAINANDPDARFYSAKALLYNWKPVRESNQPLLNWSEMSSQNTEITPPEPIDHIETGYSPGNLLNGGLATLKGDWIYYTGYCTIMRTDGVERAQLSYDNAYGINVVGNWIYYLNYLFTNDDWEGPKIYKMRTDGSDRTKMGNDLVDNLCVVGDWIYYRNKGDQKIYRMRTDGGERTILSQDDSGPFVVAGDWIYEFVLDESQGYEIGWIYRMRTDGSERTKVTGDRCLCFTVAGDWIYYSLGRDYGGLCKMRTDGSEITKVSDDYPLYSVNVFDDWIYYASNEDNFKIYKMRTDGSERTKLNDDMSVKIKIVGDWIYYEGWNDGKLYRMRTDGGERQVVN